MLPGLTELRETETKKKPGTSFNFIAARARNLHQDARVSWTFSSPEAALLLVSTKNRDLWLQTSSKPPPNLWPCPTRTSRHSAHTLSQVWQIDWQIWLVRRLVLVSINCVYKSIQNIQNWNVVGPGQRSRFLVLTKRSAASGDENVSWMNQNKLHRKLNAA